MDIITISKRIYGVFGLVLCLCFLQLGTVFAQGFPDKESLRIGVVGGGPAGLSAALRLQQAGFENVTVLEAQNEVGGKTHTIEHDGQSYEMGAIMSGPSYKEVIRLAEEFGEEIIEFSPGREGVQEYDPNQNGLRNMPKAKYLKYFAAAVEYHILYFKYRKYFREPGMQGLPEELNQPFSEWIKTKVKMPETLQELLGHSFVAFGYGYMDQVPAAYVLRYFAPQMLRSFMFGRIKMLKNGYQDLWKKVAQRLNVKLNYQVSEAKNTDGEWTVSSSSGQQEKFDRIIWTAPLDSAAEAIELPQPLEDTFSQIRYQHYFSTLAEVKGLPRGSGVVTQNYHSKSEKSLVSWLHRWPEQSSVANFYSLSNDTMSPASVEAELHDFAKDNGFQIKAVIKNIGWKYFPHFTQQELNADPYDLIEASQGYKGLYFGGEIMSMSTVKHTVNYSHELVDRFFIRKGQLSYELPEGYDVFTAQEKLSYIWQQIKSSAYSVLPTHKEANSDVWGFLRGLFPKPLSRTFSNQSDIMEKGRVKVIHKLGTAALVGFEAKDPKYNDFNAVIRVSHAVNPTSGTLYPSFALKIPNNGADPSINFSIGKSFDSQRIDNDPKGEPDYNFFRDDEKYPFSNELPTTAFSTVGKVFVWIFDWAHKAPNFVPINELTKVMNAEAPRRLVFKAPEDIQNLLPSDEFVDERQVLAQLPVGTVLFHVYESDGLDKPLRYVGDLKTQTPFIASRFGDEHLYFRHERGGVIQRPGSFTYGSPSVQPVEASDCSVLLGNK